MPNQKGHFGERSIRSTSKNAKDKSNSATMRASKGGTHIEQSGMGDMRNCMLRCDSEKDSEKDSGYSEAGSDSVHTDVDDQRSSKSSKSSKSSNNNSVNPAGHNMPPYEALTPIYVIKDLVVKPSRPEQLLHGPLAWGGGWQSLTSAKAPTQLLLIQQPAMPPPSTTTPTPSSSQAALQGKVKTGGSRSNQNRSSKNSYLPILNSYPRIAPHPRKESHEGKGTTWEEGVEESGSEGQSQRKRVCTEEEKREAVSTTSHLMMSQQHQKEFRVHSYSQYKGRGGHNSFPILSHCPLPSHASSTTQHKFYHCQQCSGSDSVGSPSVSSSQTPSPPSSSSSPSSSSPPSSSPSSSTAHSPYCLASDSSSTRQLRFLNTAEILNQSGLLAITLRTKELLKQNEATEREIAQIRQHTHLLCQVAQASQSRCNNGSDSLDKLLQAMTKSAFYPNLDLNQLKALSSSHQQSKTRTEEDKVKDNNIRTTKIHSNVLQVGPLHKIDYGTLPPSPLFAPSPDTEETQHADDPLDLMSTFLSISLPRSVPEQERRQPFMDKDLSDLTMLPESSTHNNYLL
ncbi:CLOCK-interacting pacemaker-like [Xiphias gladius]|uniref:CLOCK-interacting pacemaker-like n=1 Tax=Xiphias gladius TaxID=8245 RepID=UPI001A995A56|nr:CLOCK-interacting pacemaker-like [Xiphias gladius]XP_040005982.1 CLOCK-interacting pacemaker-like [Xiphias gladius]XP_040005984.1 CLOCK-interacting pacemaker-like [Xiphias gladius]